MRRVAIPVAFATAWVICVRTADPVDDYVRAEMKLVEDGKVRLDDPISSYLDNPPAAWAPITIRHVLTHTLGLADFDTGQLGFSHRRDYSAREFVELLARQPLQFAPGERWN